VGGASRPKQELSFVLVELALVQVLERQVRASKLALHLEEAAEAELLRLLLVVSWSLLAATFESP